MSTRIASATYSAPDRGIKLDIRDLPAGRVALWRTDANGTRRVRMTKAQAQAAQGGDLVVTDYDVALTPGTVYYSLTGYRRNVLPNASFESDLSGWATSGANGGTATLTRDTVTKLSGNASAKLVTSATEGYTESGSLAATPVKPGQTWTGSFYAIGTGTARASLIWRTASGAGTANPVSQGAEVPLGPVSGGSWSRMSVTAVAPSDAVYVQLRVSQVGAGSQTMYVDAAMVERTNKVEPFTIPDLTITATAQQDVPPYDGVASAILTVATTPYQSRGVYVADWRMTRDSGAQLHEILERTDRIDTGSAAGPRTGTVQLLCDSWDDAYSLESFILSRSAWELQGGVPQNSRTVMLRNVEHVGMDGMLIVERMTIEPDTNHLSGGRRKWRITLACTETFTGPYVSS